MNQFLLGLVAGAAVGLALEWIVDWSGLTLTGRRAVRSVTRGSRAEGTSMGGSSDRRNDGASSKLQSDNEDEA